MYKLLATKRLYSIQARNLVTKKQPKYWLWGGLGITASLFYYNYTQNKPVTSLQLSDANYIQINDKIKPFPKYIYSKDNILANNNEKEPKFSSNFILTGVGTKTAPISTVFKIFSIGIYINTERKQNLLKSIHDKQLNSDEIVKEILESKLPVLIKISPLLRSNLKFIREKGFVNCIKKSALIKNDEILLDECVKDIRQALDLNEKFAINDDLYLEFKDDQTVQFHYFNNEKNNFISMGATKEPVIRQTLLKAYLQGRNTIVPEAKQSFIINLLLN